MSIISFARAFLPACEEAGFLLPFWLLLVFRVRVRLLFSSSVGGGHAVAVGKCGCGVVLGLLAFVFFDGAADRSWFCYGGGGGFWLA